MTSLRGSSGDTHPVANPDLERLYQQDAHDELVAQTAASMAPDPPSTGAALAGPATSSPRDVAGPCPTPNQTLMRCLRVLLPGLAPERVRVDAQRLVWLLEREEYR